MSDYNPNHGKTNLGGSRVPPHEANTRSEKDQAQNQAQQSQGQQKAKDKMYDGLNKADDMANQAQSKMDQGKERAEEMANKAQQRSDEGMDKAADAMDRGAEMLRERGGQQGGAMGQAAGTAADAMETAGSYLHDTNTGEMMDQVEAYIRKNPTQSILIAAGVGFVLAKAMK